MLDLDNLFTLPSDIVNLCNDYHAHVSSIDKAVYSLCEEKSNVSLKSGKNLENFQPITNIFYSSVLITKPFDKWEDQENQEDEDNNGKKKKFKNEYDVVFYYKVILPYMEDSKYCLVCLTIPLNDLFKSVPYYFKFTVLHGCFYVIDKLLIKDNFVYHCTKTPFDDCIIKLQIEVQNKT